MVPPPAESSPPARESKLPSRGREQARASWPNLVRLRIYAWIGVLPVHQLVAEAGIMPHHFGDPWTAQRASFQGLSQGAIPRIRESLLLFEVCRIVSSSVFCPANDRVRTKKQMQVVVNDSTHTLMIPITPELTDAGDGTKGYRLGFQYVPPPLKVERLSFLKSLSASWVFNKKKSLLVFDVLKGMFERHISVTSLSGPIGIAP